MLELFSASTRSVNSRRAMDECMEAALGAEDQDCDLIMIHASMGHDFRQLADEARKTTLHVLGELKKFADTEA